jgi:hypothetical protein
MLAAVLLPLAAPADADWTAKPRSIVFFAPDAPSSREFLRELRAVGGHASVIYPGTAALVYGSDAQLARVSRWIAERYTGPIEASRFSADHPDADLVARSWNRSLEMRARRAVEPVHDHDNANCAGARRVPVELPSMPSRRDAPDHIPLGAEYYDCGSYMAGTTAVGVWLLESTGSAYNWTTAEETETIAGVQEGLDHWAGFGGTMAHLTFLLDVHTDVPVSDDPITHPQSTEATWIGQALTWAGWTGANAYEQGFAYNNALRDALETNWCYSYFIVDSDSTVNQGLFSTGGYAWAYFDGPWVYMSRYSTWAFNAPSYYDAVPMHEAGHIYYATDEYDGGSQQSSGYLNVPDSGNPNVVCIMNRNVPGSVCNFTRRQIAWRDSDGNAVMEPLDTPPDAPLDELLPDPHPGPQPTWIGTANVTTLPNQCQNSPYNPPHDITIATIAAVECRVDGGAWSPAVPTDGTLDAYVEDFSWTSPPLAPGVHTVEARSQSSEGVWSAVYGTDTITIEGTTDAVLADAALAFRLDPPRPNPASGETSIRYVLPRESPVNVSIYAVDGTRVNTLFEGRTSAGSHTLVWNGRNASGGPLPAGVYVVRLDAISGTRTAKLLWRR